jgi:TPR repeat protein
MEHLKKIKELNELRKKGILTDEEFESEKKKILGSEVSPHHEVEFKANDTAPREAIKSSEILSDRIEVESKAILEAFLDNQSIQNVESSTEIPSQKAEIIPKKTEIIRNNKRRNLILSFALLSSFFILWFNMSDFTKHNWGCHLNHGRSCLKLAYDYEYANGVSFDREKVLEFYEKACQLEDGGGCASYGYAYLTGKGTPIDKEKAFEYFEKSCRLDSDWGCAILGSAYSVGIGTSVDKGKAFESYEKSCQLEDGDGCSGVGYAYQFGIGISVNSEKAFEFYEKSCGFESGVGCSNLGESYRDGLGTNVNREKAFDLFEKACKLDIGGGCYFLGTAYRDGIGVSINLAKAKEYIKKGCEIGWEGDKEYCQNNQTNLFPKIEFKKINAELFQVVEISSEAMGSNLLPDKIIKSINIDLQNVYVKSFDGSTWATYKIDSEPIKSLVVNKGEGLFLQGKEIRLYIGNVGVTKIFYNNELINAPSISGVKSLVFPRESSSKYMLPLFPKGLDDILYTSEEYISRMVE